MTKIVYPHETLVIGMTFTIKIITKGYVQALTMADHAKSEYPNNSFVKVLSLVSKRQLKMLGSEIAFVL